MREARQYIVALSRGDDGHVVIDNHRQCHRGVYRVNCGDVIVFSFPLSMGTAVNLIDIGGDVVAVIPVVPGGLSPTVTTEAWKPTIPGPYSIDITRTGVITSNGHISSSTKDLSSFFRVESTIVVNPITAVSTESIRMLTVMPRRLGCVTQWPETLRRLVSDRGYNAAHFTPCQTSGPSHSSYSIADVLDVDPHLFQMDRKSAPRGKEDRWRILNDVLSGLSPRILTVTDVVLNHASSSDSWATSMPEATYCLQQCRYLTCAAELDQRLYALSEEHPEFLTIRSEAQLEECMQRIRTAADKFNFSEFFQIDFQASVDLFSACGRDSGGSSVSTIPPVWQAMRQAGTSRADKIVVDLRSHCIDIASVWRELHCVQRALDTAAKDCWSSVLDACRSTIRYERIEIGKVDGPLLPRYFSKLKNGDLALNNGWVMNWPAGLDFAAPGHHLVYMKRHVVAWGDCLKLRYEGETVYGVMEEYCRRVAGSFDGVRLDNCHSTPIHVLRRLIGVMRKTNPHLLVMAELFTGEAGNDVVYEATIGIDLMVREAMQIHSSSEIVGKIWGVSNASIGVCSVDVYSRQLIPTKASAILYDSTHDNSTPSVKFGDFPEALPLAVAVCASPCAVGSSVGFDTLTTCMPSVVTDPADTACARRDEDIPDPIRSGIWIDNADHFRAVSVYGDWDGWSAPVPLVGGTNGIWHLDHPHLALVNGVTEFKFVINESEWRVNAKIGVRETITPGVFNNVYNAAGCLANVKTNLLSLHRILAESHSLIFSKSHGNGIVEVRRMDEHSGEAYVFLTRFGLDSPDDTASCAVDLDSEFDSIVMAAALVHPKEPTDSFLMAHHKAMVVHPTITQLGLSVQSQSVLIEQMPKWSFVVLKSKPFPQLTPPPPPVHELVHPRDFSYVLFCCDREAPVYSVPKRGALTYAGLMGVGIEIESTISDQSIFLSSDLAENIRTGDWLFDFCASRFELRFPDLHRWLTNEVKPVYSRLPSGLKPRAFVDILHTRLLSAILAKWSSLFTFTVGPPSSFTDMLSLASFQFTVQTTVAAGLPHFSSGFMRCWGRDTFIAFAGLFLVPRRFDEARQCLLDFARVVRHGLIPNLFDDGNNPRFNARDACWFFLNATRQYLEWTKDTSVLTHRVHLKYPDRAFTFSTPSSPEHVTFGTVVEGILQSHWDGIDFVEEGAGPAIDQHMQRDGFQVTVTVDRVCGLVSGGNPLNCGTWMDKMGSSDRTGNRGFPATSRHGANIEINGIALAVLQAFVESGVISGAHFVQWRDGLKNSFDRSFWNPVTGIYSDTVNGDPKGDKLRPNGMVALSTVPLECVDKEHARGYLSRCEQELLGPLGMRTLPATDPDYNGWYDNSDESCGYNYHNGPEWVWLFGHFVIACARFEVLSPSELMCLMDTHRRHLERSPWRSLPELTNANGVECRFSCPSQAWSVCCLSEAIHHLSSSLH